MAKMDMYHSVKAVRLISPVDKTETGEVTSQEVDLQFFESLVLLFITGALTDLVATVTVQHSDTTSTGFVAVPDADLHGLEVDLTQAGDDDNKVAQIGYAGDKRFVRVLWTPTTAGTENLFGAVALLGAPQRAATTPAKFNP